MELNALQKSTLINQINFFWSAVPFYIHLKSLQPKTAPLAEISAFFGQFIDIKYMNIRYFSITHFGPILQFWVFKVYMLSSLVPRIRVPRISLWLNGNQWNNSPWIPPGARTLSKLNFLIMLPRKEKVKWLDVCEWLWRWKCGKREIQGQGQTRLTVRWLFPDRVVTETGISMEK